ncbi:MAG: acyl-protein synthetase [Clostridia bacterium]|nr:acyl-protein synthetase [Clostridia bacterium]
MEKRRKLFLKRDPYRAPRDSGLFLRSVRELAEYHTANCEGYARILRERGFDPAMLKTEDDLYKLPVLPTLFFKRNRLFSVPEKKLKVLATSSGTSGSKSVVGLDGRSLFLGVGMMIRFFLYHRVLSPVPVNYIVLGYEPSAHNDMGAAKTAYGTTKFAPALKRVYALRDTGAGYEPDPEGVYEALMRFSKGPFPVRFVGFPAYMYFLADALKKRGVSLKLPRGSKILLGGGWKRFAGEEIDRGEFYELIEKTLGIKRENCLEFYSAVEHPMAYVKCREGHFHIPAYSRVIIRDVSTLEPVEDGSEGLLSFICPLVTSMPLLSVVTDDIAVRHGGGCACGLNTPYFDLKGRAGVKGIKTCAASAAELIGGRDG